MNRNSTLKINFWTLSALFFLGAPPVAAGESCSKSDKFIVFIENKQGSWEQEYTLGQSIEIPESDVNCRVRSSWLPIKPDDKGFPRYGFPDEDHLTLVCVSKKGLQFASHASLTSAASGASFLAAFGKRSAEAILVGNKNNLYYLSVQCAKTTRENSLPGRTISSK